MMAVYLVAAVGAILTGGVVVAIVAALLRRWPLAIRISRAVALAAAAVFGALFVFTAMLFAEPSVLRALLPTPAEDPSQMARALAELISSLMNCGALSVLAGIAAAAVWFVARRRLRSAAV
jgi:hypothetical protein